MPSHLTALSELSLAVSWRLSMVRRHVLSAMVLASAVISRPALAQLGASVSLTHTVTVTVPPRVKVQVSGAQSAPAATRVSGQQSANGLALSINATQPWTLSIGASNKSTTVQWSRDGQTGFAPVANGDAVVASGVLSQVPTSASVFVRPATSASTSREGAADSAVIVLTIVAQ